MKKHPMKKALPMRCDTINISKLIDIMYKLDFYPFTHQITIPIFNEEDREIMINKLLSNNNFNHTQNEIIRWDFYKIKYYTMWYFYLNGFKRDEICKMIFDYMENELYMLEYL